MFCSIVGEMKPDMVISDYHDINKKQHNIRVKLQSIKSSRIMAPKKPIKNPKKNYLVWCS